MSAHSLATFAAMHVDSSLTLTNASLANGIIASGYARTVDALDLGSTSASIAYLGFTFHLDGTLIDSGLTMARVVFTFSFNYDDGFVSGLGPFQCPYPATSPTGGGGYFISDGSATIHSICHTPLYPIALFQQYPYFFSLAAQEYQVASSVPINGSASSHFFNTASIVSVQPYDENMQFIPDATVLSLGNDGNPFDVAPIPEPSTVLLLVVGLLLVSLLKIKAANR
jgi:hypothetical protein